MMTETKRRQCSQNVYTNRSGGLRCLHPAKVERDGKWYCKQHDPVESARKLQERDNAWQQRWEDNRKFVAEAAEQKRRAEAYPRLLAALKARHDEHGWWCDACTDAEALIAELDTDGAPGP